MPSRSARRLHRTPCPVLGRSCPVSRLVNSADVVATATPHAGGVVGREPAGIDDTAGTDGGPRDAHDGRVFPQRPGTAPRRRAGPGTGRPGPDHRGVASGPLRRLQGRGERTVAQIAGASSGRTAHAKETASARIWQAPHGGPSTKLRRCAEDLGRSFGTTSHADSCSLVRSNRQGGTQWTRNALIA